MKSKFVLYLHICIFWTIFVLHAVPGHIIGQNKATKIPVVSLESLDISSFNVLKKFNLQEHIPESNWKEHGDYFLHRERTVYLTQDQKYAIKIWNEQYPSASNFLQAVQANFYSGIAQIEGLIVDQKGHVRGYITPYMVSRNFKREIWDSFRFALEKNAFGVNIFAGYEAQPQNYKNFFKCLVKKCKKTGILCTDFCPNNVVLEHVTGKMYLVDLEDVLFIKEISLEDSTVQMLLEYNPKDYLKELNLLK